MKRPALPAFTLSTTLSILSTLLVSSVFSVSALAGAIFPVDRTAILVGSKFDFKVEFDDIVDASRGNVTIT